MLGSSPALLPIAGWFVSGAAGAGGWRFLSACDHSGQAHGPTLPKSSLSSIKDASFRLCDCNWWSPLHHWVVSYSTLFLALISYLGVWVGDLLKGRGACIHHRMSSWIPQ